MFMYKHLLVYMLIDSLSKVLFFSGDLPVFLQNQVESLTQHLRYCDSQKCFTQAEVQNLTEQKSLLLQQMQLVNQQILKYRVRL